RFHSAPRAFEHGCPAMTRRTKLAARGALFAAAACLAACASLPGSGPSAHDIKESGAGVIRVVDVDDSVVKRLLERRADKLFSEVFETAPARGEIARPLQDKANKPQVLVRRTANNTAYVTIVGEVANSTRMPLTPRGERLLDALAAAGGTKAPVDKVTLQVTRGAAVHSLTLDTVIRDPRQNISLQPGDVVTALFQPLSFTALGATGKNEEVNFEAKGISLAQGLARAGSLLDTRSNARGVFIFRLESSAVVGLGETAATAAGGQVPVVYRVDLTDPRAFFLAQ